jgi:hypothetical protein
VLDKDTREQFAIAASVLVGFGLALAFAPLGAPWAWAVPIALACGPALFVARELGRRIADNRAQIARLATTLGEARQQLAGEHDIATTKLTDEVSRLRVRVAAAERLAADSAVRLRRYDLIQRPGGFEIELFCDVCGAWRPSGVISTWEHFKRDEPFVTGDGRFFLSCGHEVRADNYKARPGAKVTAAARRTLATATPQAHERVERDPGPIALRR